MYARSVVAMLAAIATFGLVATSVQAGPPIGLGNLGATTEKSLTRVDFEICDGCQIFEGEDESEELDITDLLSMGGDLLD